MTHYSFHRPANYIERSRHPLLYEISQVADWITEDEFPAAPEWADVHEEWLRFVKAREETNRFVPRLTKSAYQRDRTFAEIATGYFLETKCSLPIIEWEPPGEAGTRGEFIVGSAAERLFVEVKTGGWEKDIKEAEGTNSPRFSQPKYIHAEARSVAPWKVIRNAVSNAYHKFPESMPTLLIIKDDYFVSLDEFNAEIALYCPAQGQASNGYLAEDGYFRTNRYESLGGAAIFNVELSTQGLRYHFALYENPNAVEAVKLPRAFFDGFPRYKSATNDLKSTG